MASPVTFTVIGDPDLNEAIREAEENKPGAKEALSQKVYEVAQERGFLQKEIKEETQVESFFSRFKKFAVVIFITGVLFKIYNFCNSFFEKN
jgi:hypothetical protein